MRLYDILIFLGIFLITLASLPTHGKNNCHLIPSGHHICQPIQSTWTVQVIGSAILSAVCTMVLKRSSIQFGFDAEGRRVLVIEIR